jgi:hypothetical protein
MLQDRAADRYPDRNLICFSGYRRRDPANDVMRLRIAGPNVCCTAANRFQRGQVVEPWFAGVKLPPETPLAAAADMPAGDLDAGDAGTRKTHPQGDDIAARRSAALEHLCASDGRRCDPEWCGERYKRGWLCIADRHGRVWQPVHPHRYARLGASRRVADAPSAVPPAGHGVVGGHVNAVAAWANVTPRPP